MTQFLRDQASDREEVVTPLMLDGTYLSTHRLSVRTASKLISNVNSEEMEDEMSDEPTCRCHQNPFIGALGIQQPVILGEPQIDQRKLKTG